MVSWEGNSWEATKDTFLFPIFARMDKRGNIIADKHTRTDFEFFQ